MLQQADLPGARWWSELATMERVDGSEFVLERVDSKAYVTIEICELSPSIYCILQKKGRPIFTCSKIWCLLKCLDQIYSVLLKETCVSLSP